MTKQSGTMQSTCFTANQSHMINAFIFIACNVKEVLFQSGLSGNQEGL